MIEPFQATFAVPLTCESCIKDISKPLYELDGIRSVEANLKDQLVLVEGTAAPSAIVAAIQNTGRDAILRGSGKSNNASVCILETHANVPISIRGLARMVQISDKRTLVDLTINGLSPGQYWATVRDTGDISRGPSSTGGIWEALKQKLQGAEEPRGVFGTVDVDEEGKGNVFLDRPVAVWELIGRSMVVSKNKEGPFKEDDPNTIVGVIARSAGVWDNDKMVCSCSGKNVWEERKEQVSRGMV
ncbi:copper chaperone [Coccidioides posadasii str. Silveira]|uniref:Superoxide dismutase 1 copper chaperone n=1 Tax=Coccidioides posadasii (strain RMSCC 757 / Silveira) TaxID=443226 RepID=E9DCV3_COCPS|nr:superoxide dismutase copper chaperone Lys7 [Coccidioides posadasii str. Silveira]QVM09548.1 copper chaperone [Coccidioides posadasii str. Silveira]